MADADITPVTFFRRKGNRANHRKRPPTPPPKASDSDSDYSSADESGAKLPSKRQKTTHVVSSSSTSTKPTEGKEETITGPTYTADRTSTISKSDDATKRSNWHNENEEEYLIRKSKPSSSADDVQEDDGVYRGPSAYKSFIKKNPDSIQNKGKMGPVKAPTNVRQVVTVDFAPDVCKDYKQTGFCGFGDTCKFLHAREDYKQGWQLDRDWEVSSKKKQGKDTKDDEEDDDKELANIPFKCVICKGDYKSPIVTKCGHYFCEKCALLRYRKTPSCAICGAGTNGIFNTAKNLQKKLERKREREEQKKKEEGEDNDEGGEQAGASGITIEE
ncbi:RNA-splicing factor [Arthrobotrys musiformis]|uniref:Pre-mRNA-splicing factor CWC24 n=1 Tax=Arthrobotrys musiformis TaxID=47236 RepID=A0AAV9WCX9_9PEZI